MPAACSPPPLARTSKASDCRASPTRTAAASPKTTCVVGRPRRRSSSSMHGRSSWTRLYVWISSTAAMGAQAAAGSQPQLRAASATRPGRSRLPPATSGCRSASRRPAGAPVRASSARSSAASASGRKAARSASAARDWSRVHGLTQESSPSPLAPWTRARKVSSWPRQALQLDPAPVAGQAVLERELAPLQLAHERLELLQPLIETRLLVRLAAVVLRLARRHVRPSPMVAACPLDPVVREPHGRAGRTAILAEPEGGVRPSGPRSGRSDQDRAPPWTRLGPDA